MPIEVFRHKYHTHLARFCRSWFEVGLVSVGQWGRDSGRALFSFSNGSGLMLTLHVKLVLILMLHMLPSHSLDFVI